MPAARSTTILNGTDLLLYVDSTHVIASSTTCGITVNRDMRDISNKDSAGWKAVLPGQGNWTASCEALMFANSSYNYAYLMGAIIAKTSFSLKFQTTNAAGDVYYSGSAYLTSVSITAQNEQNGTLTANFQGTGALAITDPLSP